MTAPAVLPSLPGSAGKYDLRTFFRSVGEFSGERALLSSPTEREEPETPAELLDEDVKKVVAKPLPVEAFVDGVQASLLVTHRAHRPVYLNYVAAGAVARGARPLGLREKLTIVCSTVDREWVDSLETNIPVEELACEMPPDVERTASQILGGDREALERGLVEDMTAAGTTRLAVDGSLLGRPYHLQLISIAKSTGRKYLADESCLFGLPAGWRSPRFKIPGGSAGDARDRYSVYVRLFDASRRAWNFGLVRIESFDPEILDAAAALCLSERQSPAGGDPRFDRHLASVRACEEFLRSRRPSVFRLG